MKYLTLIFILTAASLTAQSPMPVIEESFPWVNQVTPSLYSWQTQSDLGLNEDQERQERSIISPVFLAQDGPEFRLENYRLPNGAKAYDLYLVEGNFPVGSLSAAYLVIPGNGYIYAFHSLPFAHPEVAPGYKYRVGKYLVKDQQLLSISQPEFRPMLFAASAGKDIVLYQAPNSALEVGRIPQGREMQVIGYQRDENAGEWWFLIKTKLGLLGWHQLETENMSQTSINGLYWLP